MKIELNTIERMSICKFAERHNLTMLVNERKNPSKGLARFYATFKDIDLKEDRLIVGAYGDGESPDSAIANYAKVISNKTLVKGAFTKNRIEINAPEFY
jgi:hypothetical protein